MRNIIVLICVLGISFALFAQTDKDSWTSLNGLKGGQDIQVVDRNSRKHTGIFTGVSESAIALTTNAGQESLEKQNVRTVKLLKPNRRRRNTLIGAGVGAATGAILFGAAWASDPWGKNTAGVTTAAAGIGAVFLAPVGAIVGVALPSHGSTTIYRASSH